MPFKLGPMELALILLVVLIVFGPGKLPKVGEAVGRTIREFRKASHDEVEGSAPKEKVVEKQSAKAEENQSTKPG